MPVRSHGSIDDVEDSERRQDIGASAHSDSVVDSALRAADGSASADATTAGALATGAPAAAVKAAPDLAKNMTMTALGNAVAPLAALASTPILSYALGVTGRGELAAATAPLLLGVVASTFGLPESIMNLVARRPAALVAAVRRGALLITLAGLIGTAIVVACAGLLSGGSASVQQLIVLASLALVPSLLVLVLRAGAAGLHQWRLVALEQVLVAIARLGGVAVLAAFGVLTPLTATIVMALAPVVAGIVYIPLIRRRRELVDALMQRIGPLPPLVDRGRHHIDGSPTAAPYPVLLSFGTRVWFGSLSGVLLSRIDQVLVTPLSNAYELGLYVAAVNISDVALVLNSAMRDVTTTADAADRDDDRLSASARISFLLSFGLGGTLALLLPFGLPLLFGQAFAPAVTPGWILLAAVVLITPGSIAGAGLSARGRPGLRTMSLALACVINIALLFVLVPQFGAVGAALATLVGNFVCGASNVVLLSRTSGIPLRRFLGVRRSDLRIIRDKANGLLRTLTRGRVAIGR